MARVTVEGSSTPCVDLPAGVRKTVEYSHRVRERVRRGYYLVVDGPHDDEPDTAGVERLQRNPETLERIEAVAESDLDEAVEVETHDHDPGPEQATETDPEEIPGSRPAGNASKVEWLAFLRARQVDIPVDADGKTPGRDELKAIWEDEQAKANGEG